MSGVILIGGQPRRTRSSDTPNLSSITFTTTRKSLTAPGLGSYVA